MAQAPSVQDVVTAQRQYFARMQTVDLTYTTEYTGMPQENRGPLRRTSRFRGDGLRYRVEKGLDDSVLPPRETDGGEIVAFDLERYQYFDKANMRLLVQRSPAGRGYMDNVPLLQPFEPVIPDVTARTLEALTGDEQVWKSFAAQAKVEDAVDFAGRRCWPVAVHGERGLRFRWYLADEIGLFPVGYENYHENGVVAARYVTTDLQTVKTNRGDIAFPLSATWKWYSDDGAPTVKTQFSVNPRSVAINQPIDQSVFSISPAMSRVYVDREYPDLSYRTDDMARETVQTLGQPLANAPVGGDAPQQVAAAIPAAKSTAALSPVSIPPTENLHRRWSWAARVFIVLAVVGLIAAFRLKRRAQGQSRA